MHESNVIEVRNVSKKFRVYPDRGHSLKEKMMSFKRNRYDEKQVLEDISFDVRRGESVGFIGHNGCGKSTMLKMLTKIMYPDSGSIEIAGKVSSLLELGAGFHPDMSGRDNIYINASIFGLSRKEIDGKLQEIIDFSELEEYIDNPVRTYSSGMYMRLAFAVAINVNADVLIVDEILAVGDINFQRKCLNKMREIQNEGTTVVLVSHSMDQIMDVCDRCVWIQDGRVTSIGECKKVVQQYMDYMEAQNTTEEVEVQERIIEHLGEISNPRFLVNGKDSEPEMNMGDHLQIGFHYLANESHKIFINIDIVREDFLLCYYKVFNNGGQYYELAEGDVTIDLGKLALFPGKYNINLRVITEDGARAIDEAPFVTFAIVGTTENSHGVIALDTSCCVKEKNA